MEILGQVRKLESRSQEALKEHYVKYERSEVI